MKIEVGPICYSHLVYMLQQGPKFSEAIHSFTCNAPAFEFEGMAGYIECKPVFEVKDLQKFTDLYNAWYTESIEDRNTLYNSVKKNGCRMPHL